jgi:hypothetical protein
MADIDSTRISLGEQIQADYSQVEAGKVRLVALQSSLSSSDKLAKAWGRQFVAGRKTWLDVMNAVREQAQLETQIADARASQLLLTWRLAIVGRGLDSALVMGQNAVALAPQRDSSEPVLADALPREIGEAFGQVSGVASLPDDAIVLRITAQLDQFRLGTGMGSGPGAKGGARKLAESDTTGSPPAAQHNIIKEGIW